MCFQADRSFASSSKLSIVLIDGSKFIGYADLSTIKVNDKKTLKDGIACDNTFGRMAHMRIPV